ncbi:peptidase associated/transthyretin-like domain-containing protein [Spirosoma flavum]|uniref:Carboxypeptidase-like regulatory domain-containing protein n=1 Tax=Spirosoma flavum TaxID=2048557 RepID=A0ABW6ATP1_9BACT
MKIILCLLFLINYSLCLAQNRKGVYTIQREKSALGNKSIISGSVVDFATNQPLKVAVIKIDTTLIQTDTLGHFRQELSPGKHQVRAGFIGYYLIDLGKISLRKGELINILFRVKEDTRPLID